MISNILRDITPNEVIARARSLVIWDIETTGLKPRESEITDCGFCWKEGSELFVCSFPWDDEVANILRELGKREKIIFGNQNIKFDARFILEKNGIDVIDKIQFDSLIIEQIINPDRWHRKSLDCIAERYGICEGEELEFYRGMKKQRGQLQASMFDDMYKYNCMDTEFVMRALAKQKESGIVNWPLYFDLELPLLKNLLRIEQAGVIVDQGYLAQSEENLIKEQTIIAKQIEEIAGKTWNINSDAQTRVVLFDELKLPIIAWTEGGKAGLNKQPAVDYETIKVLNRQCPHPILPLFQDYVKISDQLSKYVNPFKSEIYPDGKIRTVWKQSGEIKGGTASGRLTSSDPPMQVMTTNDKAHALYKPRKIIHAPDEDLWVVAFDADQIELRWMAFECQEKKMLDVFKQGKDIHTATAAEVYGIPYNSVSSSQRKVGKLANFSIGYGASGPKLVTIGAKNDVFLTVEEAYKIVNRLRDRYPKIKEYKDHIKSLGTVNGYVENYLGRRRYFSNIGEDNFKGWADDRAAFNHCIQSGASDFIKYLLNKICKSCDWTLNTFLPVLLVHDEIVFYCTTEKLKDLIDIINTAKNEVPLPDGMPKDYLLLTGKMGKNYSELDINAYDFVKNPDKHLIRTSK